MERTPELTEFATLIYAEMKEKVEKKEHPRCEHIIRNDNPELEDFDVHMYFGLFTKNGISSSGEKKIFWGVTIASQKIRNNDECDGMETYQIREACRPAYAVEGKEEPEIIKHLEDCICDIDAQVARLVPDKNFGVFVDPAHEPSVRQMKMWELQQRVFKHRKPLSTCCVCDVETQHVTKCGHKLCFMCWNKLKKLTCPCCRAEIDDQTNHSDSDED